MHKFFAFMGILSRIPPPPPPLYLVSLSGIYLHLAENIHKYTSLSGDFMVSVGKSATDLGKFTLKGSPFISNGRSFTPKGPPIHSKGSPFTSKGNPFILNGGPFTPNGPPFTLKGSLFTSKGNPFILNGRPFTPKGSPFTLKGSPCTSTKRTINRFNPMYKKEQAQWQ
jgi:hypothetical protein